MMWAVRAPASGLADPVDIRGDSSILQTNQTERMSRLTEALADPRGWDALLQDIGRRLTLQQCGCRSERLLVGYHQPAVPTGWGPDIQELYGHTDPRTTKIYAPPWLPRHLEAIGRLRSTSDRLA